MMDMELNEYRSLLERLKRNKENVPLELLTTKYQKSYGQLKENIQAMTRGILQDMVLGDLRIERSQAREKYEEINTAIRESGILEKVSHAVFRQYDVDQVLENASQLQEIVHRIVKGREENAG